jgi:hypothetical protein
MRTPALLLLLPTLAFAQPPATNAQPPAAKMDPQQFFEQSKARMQPIMAESLPAMKKTLACMQKAEDQGAYEKCAEIMSELDKKMREKMGMPADMPAGHSEKMKDPKELEWNAENKKKMLMFLEHSITVGTAMNDCFDKSTTMDQMQQCIQASKAKP